MSAAIRQKRMGFQMPKKDFELGFANENKPDRFGSHLRGSSHSAVYPQQAGNVGSGYDSSNPASPAGPDRQRVPSNLVRRLSSLPEHGRESKSALQSVEAAKGILYSISLVHSHITNFIRLAREGHGKKSSLERIYYNAASHFQELDRLLAHHAKLAAEKGDNQELRQSFLAIGATCDACLRAYDYVATYLWANVGKIVHKSDPRYLRTLLLLLYGSWYEARNACELFGVKLKPKRSPRTPQTARPRDIRSTTPIRGSQNSSQRIRSTTMVRNSKRQALPMLHPPPPHPVPLNGGSRSRTNTMSSVSSATPTMTSSPVSTFSTSTLTARASNLPFTPVMEMSKDEENSCFEKIYMKLMQACDTANTYLPGCYQVFVEQERKVVSMKAQGDDPTARHLSYLTQACQVTIGAAETLKARLEEIRLQDPVARGRLEFWQQSNAFVKVSGARRPNRSISPCRTR